MPPEEAIGKPPPQTPRRSFDRAIDFYFYVAKLGFERERGTFENLTSPVGAHFGLRGIANGE
jgi:hypothetical protein